MALHLNKFKTPSPKDGQVWLKMASGSGEEVEHVKSLQTDGRRTTGDQKSSLEASAQLS